MYKNDVEFWATMEATSGDLPTAEIETLQTANGLQYIRFKACLQAFVDKFNRNKRAWKPGFIKTMIAGEVIQEQLLNGGVPGEAGHPVPATGQVTLERICTIEPMRVSHYVKEFTWKSNNYLYGTIETAAGIGDSPGTRLMAQVLQGINPAFSARTIVPQRKEANGTTTVLGPGRLIGYDWVYGPSHKEAYRDKSVKVTLVNKSKFDVDYATEAASLTTIIMDATEAYTENILRNSSNVNRILDGYDPIMETAGIDSNGIFSCATEQGSTLYIPTEDNFKKDIKNFMLSMNNW